MPGSGPTGHLLLAVSVNSSVATIAAIWGVVMAVAPALQIRRMVHTGSSRDVSSGYFLLLLPGFLLWVLHGVLNHDLALAIPNAVSLTTALLLLAVAAYYRSRRPGSRFGEEAGTAPELREYHTDQSQPPGAPPPR